MKDHLSGMAVNATPNQSIRYKGRRGNSGNRSFRLSRFAQSSIYGYGNDEEEEEEYNTTEDEFCEEDSGRVRSRRRGGRSRHWGRGRGGGGGDVAINLGNVESQTAGAATSSFADQNSGKGSFALCDLYMIQCCFGYF